MPDNGMLQARKLLMSLRVWLITRGEDLRPHEPSREAADKGDEYPRHNAFDGGVEVRGKPTASTEASEGARNHPAAGKEIKTFNVVRSLDDFDGPFSNLGQGATQLVDGVTPVGEYV
jgi:hypothetical protein